MGSMMFRAQKLPQVGQNQSDFSNSGKTFFTLVGGSREGCESVVKQTSCENSP